MSGAGVFADDALLGVVTEHSVSRGPSDITVTPRQFLSEPSRAPANASRWWKVLGLDDPATVMRLPAPLVPTDDPPDVGYQFLENRLTGRRICTAVWNHAGD